MRLNWLLAAAFVAASSAAHAACPAITVADMKGVAAGKYPQQFELAEFEAAAGCKLEFKENPDIASLNGKIQGNPDLPPLAERLPEEPLVVVPYASIGKHGGTLDVLSNATEAGTSDFLSVRHVNFVRFSDDLQTIVPNIAKDWKWNDDFTQLTFFLRKGHKWSDGAPFTSADVKFWYDDLNFDKNVIEKPKDYLTVGGKRMTVDTPDAHTVVFNLPASKPGLLSHFATHFAQGFQPVHFLGKFHPKHNRGCRQGSREVRLSKPAMKLINFYHGQSDWTDTPSPMLRDLPQKLRRRCPTQRSRRSRATSTCAIPRKAATWLPIPYFHPGRHGRAINCPTSVRAGRALYQRKRSSDSEAGQRGSGLQIPVAAVGFGTASPRKPGEGRNIRLTSVRRSQSAPSAST